jgi:hypothetical protein
MLANGSPRLAVCLFRRLLPWVQACPRGGVRRGPLRHDPAENSSRRGGDLHATRAARSQCRTTIEALAEIKNPPIVYARQANFRPPVCEVSAARGPATALRRITCCLLVQIGWVRSRLPNAVLDAELVVPSADGHSDFEELRGAICCSDRG